MRRHLQDLPWVTDGLGLTERLLMQAIAAGAGDEEALSRHFAAGQGQPVTVIGNAAQAERIQSAFASTPGISQVADPVVRDGLVLFDGTLRAAPDTPEAQRTVENRSARRCTRCPGRTPRSAG